jgi:hypothetical protein
MLTKTRGRQEEIGETTRLLTQWLLSDDVQMRTGPETGGVLGWFEEPSPKRFLYPEVTGYYLTFLAFLSQQGRRRDAFQQYAQLAADWLDRRCAGEMPEAARVYMHGDESSDWRRGFCFSFDLAMIWRGITLSRELLASSSSHRVLAAVERHLSRFASPGDGLRASIPLVACPSGGSWASRSGAFQTKCAAALLYSGTEAPETVRTNAETTMAEFCNWSPDEFQPELLHHDLYFVEGLLMAGVAAQNETYLKHTASVLHSLADAHQPWLWDESSSLVRSDVLAQILRTGCLLRATGYLPREPWNELLPRLAGTLSGYCGTGGVMYFRRGSAGQLEHINVWSGLFAAQALMWYRQWEESALSLESVGWLI